MKKVAIIVIHYNTADYLETCLGSIAKQTYKNLEVYFIDNDSPDKSGIQWMQKNYGGKPNFAIIPNEENSGYAKAANQGIRLALANGADYIAITNPDIIYSPSYFEKVVARINKDPKVASITGKVYKYDFPNKKTTKIIDTVGLLAYKNRRIVDDGQGLLDEGQFNKERAVFGVSGACPLYRSEALEDAAVMGEYFDEDFFMYKEDVDLAWRLQLLGWKSWFYPKAVAYHGRGTGIHKRYSKPEILKNRKNLNRFQKSYSFKNQLLMEVKNELPGALLADLHHILFIKVARPLYTLIREPYLLKQYWTFLKQLPNILKKRKIIMKKKRIPTKAMRQWFKRKSDYLK